MLIDGQYLFPLRLLRLHFDGYYFDRNGGLFSTRGSAGRLKQLNGSRTPSGHYYTLSGTTYRHDVLFNEAKAHQQFRANTTGMTEADLAMQKAVVQTVGAIKDMRLGDIPEGVRSYARNVEDGVARKGVILATVVGDKLVFGTNPKVHTTDNSWRDEAERIAKLRPGLKVVALKIVGSVVSKGVHWE